MSIRNFFKPASKRSRDQDDRNDDRNDDRHDERNDDRLDDRNDDRYEDRNEDHRDDRNDGRQDDHQGNRGLNRQENPNFSRDPYRSLPLDDKRKLYRCKDTYLELEEIPYWPMLFKMNLPRIKKAIEKNCSKDRWLKQTAFSPNDDINMKVSLWQGDITKLEIDAIANAANERCLGGGGVDGSIHKAAGPSLRKECELLNGCCTGEAKITSGHLLPAKHVIHTVGPRGENKEKLSSCYRNSLEIALSDNLRTLAFCCISTGVFGYPNREAAHVALLTTRKWLEIHPQSVDRIIFCTYLSQDFEIYQELMAKLYFPVSDGKPKEESPGATTKVPQEVSATSKVPIESEDSPKICKSTKIPSESDERQDSLPALDRGSGDIDPKLALGPLQNCEVIDDIQNNPSSSDNLPSIDYSDHDPKRAVETQDSVFENVEGSFDSNYVVDVDRTEQACEHEMESGSQQLDDVEMESQRGDDMEMGSKQP